jgi:hypothetical protein
MKSLIIILLLVGNILCFADDVQERANEKLKLGLNLYHTEKSSWISSDLLTEKYMAFRSLVGGYVSYKGEKDYVYTLFYSKGDDKSPVIRFRFDTSFDKSNPVVETKDLTMNELEIKLIKLREIAAKEIFSDNDSLFQYYKETRYNLIPIEYNDSLYVYVLTAPLETGYLIIGNDYKLTFNSEFECIKKQNLHNTLIKVPYKGEKDKKIEMTVHTHVISDIIDETDICTMLLYKEFLEWNQHFVFGEEYVSLFKLEPPGVIMMKRDIFMKIMDDKKE